MSDIDKWLNLIRGLIRPILSLVVIGILATLTIMLAGRFADKEVAIALIYFFTGAGTTILGFWFGERKASK